MQGIGIFDGDLLIVDRAAERRNGAIVVAAVDGELTCKILDIKAQQLRSANPDYPPITIGDMDLCIEGVVTHSVRTHDRPN